MAEHSVPWIPEDSSSGQPLPLICLKGDADGQLSAIDRDTIQARLNWNLPRQAPTRLIRGLIMPLVSDLTPPLHPLDSTAPVCAWTTKRPLAGP